MNSLGFGNGSSNSRLLVGCVLRFYLGGAVVGFVSIGLAVIYWILLGMFQSALQTIFQTALYLYARDGEVQGFQAEMLEGALSKQG